MTTQKSQQQDRQKATCSWPTWSVLQVFRRCGECPCQFAQLVGVYTDGWSECARESERDSARESVTAN